MSNINFTFNGTDSVSMDLPSGRVTLLTDGIEALIVQLAQFRAQMKPEVRERLQTGNIKEGL